MRRPIHALSVLIPVYLLAACHPSPPPEKGRVASITIGQGGAGGGRGGQGQTVSIDVPGFSGTLAVPGLALGGAETRIDDMPFFPGTRVTGINVTGEAGDGSGGRGEGRVDMAFAAPGDSGRLVAWYRDQAGQHGWTIVPPAGGHQFEATRDEAGRTSRFALQVAPQGSGSAGHLLVSGS